MARMMWRTLLVAVFLVTLAGVSAGGTKQIRYVGIHPVPAADGGGICHIEAPHVHIYAGDKVQYREHDGELVFVGDPVAYGYDGPRYAYKGHHPIDLHVVIGDEEHDSEWCYLDGAHYHPFAASGPNFVLTGGAYFYVGAPTKVYVDARPAMVKINAMYRPLVYSRPVITVAAPSGWIGARVEVVGPRRKVLAPNVRVSSPAIWVELGVVAPGVIIYDDQHHHHRYKRHHKHKKFKRYDHDDD